MPLVEEYCAKKNWTFPMGIDRAYDLNVLEYPFAMWQYGVKKAMDLPGQEATAKELFDMLMSVTDLMWFSDSGLKQFLPHYYQAMTEMGYYGYDVEPFKKYMNDKTYITYDFALTPYGLDTTFNPKTLPFLHDFVQNKGDHILAARFLQRFVADTPWLHVDLSASRCKGGLGAVASDITGFGVALGVALLSADAPHGG